MCSTPEGIGAAVTAILYISSAKPVICAQRPKASERRSHVNLAYVHKFLRSAQRPKASERRSHSYLIYDKILLLCAQRPKASERRSHTGTYTIIDNSNVLNARRHRSGGHATKYKLYNQLPVCSTPEGIGAAVTLLIINYIKFANRAQRPKASERRSLNYISIRPQAGTGAQRPKASERRSRSPALFTRTPPKRAQRPKASERRSPSAASVRSFTSSCAQRPKASERRSPLQGYVPAPLVWCSTPEGIGAAVTTSGVVPDFFA